MWIEILRAGTHTAKNGIIKTWTEADLDTMARQYNPQYHEAPVGIGDISDSSPAHGWVDRLKREGKNLLGWITQATPELVDIIRKGAFNKRAVSFYPDFSLRRIAFSGAVPSVISSCRHFTFQEDCGGRCIEFAEDGDPEKELKRKILEVLDNPPKYDYLGNKWPPFGLAQLYEHVLATNPKLQQRVDEQKIEDWAKSVRSLLFMNFCEQDSPGGILNRKTLEICLERSCSFGEAFPDACRQNPESAHRYAEIIHGK